MTIDRQRIAAVEFLQSLNYSFADGQWHAPAGKTVTMPNDNLIAAADAMHDEIIWQCEELAGCVEGSPEADTLERLSELAQAYEDARPER